LISVPIFALAAANMSGYYSTQHPKAEVNNGATAAAAKTYPYTDITIINSSFSVMYATVPGTSIYDMIYPNNSDHIYNDNPNIYWTHIRLLDPSQNVYRSIFEGDVCRRAIITVSGGPGNYTTNVNSSAC
jgi:hypothetical protein